MELKSGYFLGKILNIPCKNLLEVEIQEPDKLFYYANRNYYDPEKIVMKSDSKCEEGIWRQSICYIYNKDIVYILKEDTSKINVGDEFVFGRDDIFTCVEIHEENIDTLYKNELSRNKKNFFEKLFGKWRIS